MITRAWPSHHCWHFLRWLDQDTGTDESMRQSLVISGFALYWGITLSLAFDPRDISLHWGTIMSERILLRHATLLDLFHIETYFFFRGGQMLSSCYHDDFEERRFILIRWWMIGCTPLIDVWFGDAYTGAWPTRHWWWFCEMTVYVGHLLSRDHSALRAYPFWDGAFILGHSHLADFDIETPFRVYDCCFRWIIESLTPWAQSS